MVPVVDVLMNHSSAGEIKVATCRFNLRRGQITCAFSYEDAYLALPDAYAVDPALPLNSATYHCDGVPGALRDSAPDRWGRHLIDRQVSYAAEAHGGVRCLDEVDYLLGVHDQARQGALRYALPGENAYESREGEVPPVVQLKRLLRAANEIAVGNDGKSQVKELLDAGSGSLGGARPKASVVDEGKIFLAKFSHPGDQWDVMAWEKVSLDIAAAAGVEVPESRLVKVGDQRVLLLSRFDRQASLLEGDRFPYLSGMSLVGARDGESCDYCDVAEALADWADEPANQLGELFRRVVLTIALNNTDDHLRNLGLLRRGNVWSLSPAFDVNINPDMGRSHVTSVYGEAGAGAAGALRDFADVCGLSSVAARDVVRQVLGATKACATTAQRTGCKQSEIDLLAAAVQKRTQEIATQFEI